MCSISASRIEWHSTPPNQELSSSLTNSHSAFEKLFSAFNPHWSMATITEGWRSSDMFGVTSIEAQMTLNSRKPRTAEQTDKFPLCALICAEARQQSQRGDAEVTWAACLQLTTAPLANCERSEYMTPVTIQLNGNNEINVEMMLNFWDVQAEWRVLSDISSVDSEDTLQMTGIFISVSLWVVQQWKLETTDGVCSQDLRVMPTP